MINRGMERWQIYEKRGIRVNKDTYYLNHFIRCAHNGTFNGLGNNKLREYGIQVEHYSVSTGFAEIIRKIL